MAFAAQKRKNSEKSMKTRLLRSAFVSFCFLRSSFSAFFAAFSAALFAFASSIWFLSALILMLVSSSLTKNKRTSEPITMTTEPMMKTIGKVCASSVY